LGTYSSRALRQSAILGAAAPGLPLRFASGKSTDETALHVALTMFQIHIGPSWFERLTALSQAEASRLEALLERLEAPVDLVCDSVNLTGDLPPEPALLWMDALTDACLAEQPTALQFERSPAVLLLSRDQDNVRLQLAVVRAPWQLRVFDVSVPEATFVHTLRSLWITLARRACEVSPLFAPVMNNRLQRARNLSVRAAERQPESPPRTIRVRHRANSGDVVTLSIDLPVRTLWAQQPPVTRPFESARGDGNPPTRSPVELWMLAPGTLRVVTPHGDLAVPVRPGLVATLLADTVHLLQTDPHDPRLRTDMDWEWAPRLFARRETDGIRLVLIGEDETQVSTSLDAELMADLVVSLAQALASAYPAMSELPGIRRLAQASYKAEQGAETSGTPTTSPVEASPSGQGRRAPRPISASSVQFIRVEHVWSVPLSGKVLREVRRVGATEWLLLTDTAAIRLADSDTGAQCDVIAQSGPTSSAADARLFLVDPRGTRSRESLSAALRARAERWGQVLTGTPVLAAEPVRNAMVAGVRWLGASGQVGVLLDDGTAWTDEQRSPVAPLESGVFFSSWAIGVAGEMILFRDIESDGQWVALAAREHGVWAPASYVPHGDRIWIARHTSVAEHRWGAESAVWMLCPESGDLRYEGILATERLVASPDGVWLAGIYEADTGGWELRLHAQDGSTRVLHHWDDATWGFDVAWRGRSVYVALGVERASPVPFQYEHPDIQRVFVDTGRGESDFTGEELVGNPVFVHENRMPGTVALYDDLRLLFLDAEGGRTIGQVFAFWNDVVWSEIDERGDVLIIESVPAREGLAATACLRAHRLEVVGLLAPVIAGPRNHTD